MKSLADNRRRSLDFVQGEKVYWRVSPMKGIMRFSRNGKLSQKFVGLLEILEVGELAYHLVLPLALFRVHNVYHVSQLRRFILDLSHVLETETLHVQEKLIKNTPLELLIEGTSFEKKGHTLRKSAVVQPYSEMMGSIYPQLFDTSGKS